MTSKFLRPTLMALAVSTSPAFFVMAHAAEEMDHSKMDHSKMGAMDHSKMSMDDGQMDGMEKYGWRGDYQLNPSSRTYRC